MIDTLKGNGFDDAKISTLSSLIIDELRKGLDHERMARAESLFKSDVSAGTVQFRLRLDGRDWQMPKQIIPTLQKARRKFHVTTEPLWKKASLLLSTNRI